VPGQWLLGVEIAKNPMVASFNTRNARRIPSRLHGLGDRKYRLSPGQMLQAEMAVRIGCYLVSACVAAFRSSVFCRIDRSTADGHVDLPYQGTVRRLSRLR